MSRYSSNWPGCVIASMVPDSGVGKYEWWDPDLCLFFSTQAVVIVWVLQVLVCQSGVPPWDPHAKLQTTSLKIVRKLKYWIKLYLIGNNWAHFINIEDFCQSYFDNQVRFFWKTRETYLMFFWFILVLTHLFLEEVGVPKSLCKLDPGPVVHNPAHQTYHRNSPRHCTSLPERCYTETWILVIKLRQIFYQVPSWQLNSDSLQDEKVSVLVVVNPSEQESLKMVQLLVPKG